MLSSHDSPRFVQHAQGMDRSGAVRELAERCGVPTGTASKAVDILRADGVIVAKHGLSRARRFAVEDRIVQTATSNARSPELAHGVDAAEIADRRDRLLIGLVPVYASGSRRPTAS
jgi:DNA-binding transcriptional regulator YhcF (GntR family)